MTILTKNGLIISPASPYPSNQGNRIRIREVCENILSIKNLDLDFLLFPLDFHPDANLRPIRKTLEKSFHDVFIGPYFDLWHTLPLDQKSHTIDEWISEEMKKLVSQLVLQHKYDFVIVNYVFFSGLLTLFPSTTFKILDTHDILSGREKLFDQIGQEKDFFWCSKHEEKKGIDRADLVLTIKKSELNYFSQITDKNCLNLPVYNTYPESLPEAYNAYINPRPSLHSPLRIGFIGAGTKWNIAAITNFVTETYHLFYRSQFYVEIVIAGRVCSSLSILKRYPHINLMGEVEDVQTFYDYVDLIFNPDFCSTGLKIKSIEALNYNKLLIASYHATDGLAVKTPSLACKTNFEIFDMMYTIAKTSENYNSLLRIQNKSFKLHENYCKVQFASLLSRIQNYCNEIIFVVFDSKSLLSCFLTRELIDLYKSSNINIVLQDLSYDPVNSKIALSFLSKYCKVIHSFGINASIDLESILSDLENSTSSNYKTFFLCHHVSSQFAEVVIKLLSITHKKTYMSDFFLQELSNKYSGLIKTSLHKSANIVVYPSFFVDDEFCDQCVLISSLKIFDYSKRKPMREYFVQQMVTLHNDTISLIENDFSLANIKKPVSIKTLPVIKISSIIHSFLNWHSLSLSEVLLIPDLVMPNDLETFGFWKSLQGVGISYHQ